MVALGSTVGRAVTSETVDLRFEAHLLQILPTEQVNTVYRIERHKFENNSFLKW